MASSYKTLYIAKKRVLSKISLKNPYEGIGFWHQLHYLSKSTGVKILRVAHIQFFLPLPERI